MNEATIERYMNPRLVTIDSKSNAKDIAKVMDQNNVSSIVITGDNSEIIGIFTERDMVKIISRNLQPDKIIAISPPVIYIDKDMSVDQASEIMMKNKVRHLLVRDPTSKEIVGIMTNTDLVRYLRNLTAIRDFEPILEAASIETEY